jgi:PhnB protein
MQVTPYLMLDGRADEAIEFYKTNLGATVKMLMRFKESPDQTSCAVGSAEKVMHACIAIGDSNVMLSDGNNTGKPEFKGVSLTLGAKSEEEAETMFAGLGNGGQVQMPLTKTFFAKRFGMVADKFGVNWMVIAE